MGFMRKALFVSTGGLSGVAGVKANSKKERTAKAAEKQLRIQKQQLRAAKIAARSQTSSHQQPQPTRVTSAVSTSQNPAATNPSLATELERLAALHETGALSNEEFAAAKGRLLGSASAPPPRQELPCSVGPCTESRAPGSNYCPKHGPTR